MPIQWVDAAIVTIAAQNSAPHPFESTSDEQINGRGPAYDTLLHRTRESGG